MKHHIYIIILSVFIFWSCEDTLEQRLSTELEVEDAITDINSLKLAANGSYSLFAHMDNYNRTVMLLPEVMSDNAFIDAFSNTGRYLDYDNYSMNETDKYANDLWNNLTSIIATTSITINQADRKSVV